MAKTDRNLTVVNSMTEEYFGSLKNSEGKIPALANQLVMTDEEDTISSTARQLVCEHTFGAGSSFQCAELDLQADGGVYDIVIGFPQASQLGNAYFRFNNESGGSSYVYGQFSATASVTSNINGVGDRGLLGMYSSQNPAMVIMTVCMNNNTPFWKLTYFGYNNGVVMSQSYGYTVSGNITSMQILPNSSLPAGTNIKIYRRIK